MSDQIRSPEAANGYAYKKSKITAILNHCHLKPDNFTTGQNCTRYSFWTLSANISNMELNKNVEVQENLR